MDIGTADAKRIVNVGSATNLYSLYSTARALLGQQNKRLAVALRFLESGNCDSKNCAKAIEQLNRISGELAKHPPIDAVWDIDHPHIKAPWDGNLAPSVTSCANLHTTSEGDLLITELISLLRFAESTKQDVVVLG